MAIKALRTPDERFHNLDAWPYAPHYIDDLKGYEGLRMHYVDEGPIDAEVTFLCIHGEPSWAYLFRKMIPVFTGAGHRAVAVDMFGFGRSDKPVDDDVYRFHFHRNSLLEFVERMDLKNVCLVVQDWGGVLGLTLPMEAPDRYSRLLVMNTGLPTGENAGEGFAAWRAYNRANPDLDVGGLMKRATPILTDAEVHAYNAPFPDKSYKGGVRRFPELVMLKEGPDDDLTELSREGVETSRKARTFWSEEWSGDSFMAIGMQDPVLGPPAMAFLHSIIKNCPEPMKVDDAGHFVQEWGEPIAKAALEKFGIA
ncbi:haloalkane dehalogenase [Hyphococcus sp. DH-69]|uniref:haloalkane dehalogenase n=1 Tax=Hyphococcus formosus TaxID=3143534 RepID=UPI00398A89C0